MKTKKYFLGEEIIEDFSALNYLIDFYFLKYKLAVDIDELGHADIDLIKINIRQTETAKYLDFKVIRINPDKKNFSDYDRLVEIYKFFNGFKKREIRNLEKESEELRKENERLRKEKHSLKQKNSKWLLELKFEKNYLIKSKCLK